MARARPVIGLTADLVGEHARLRGTYLRAVEAAGGVPVMLPPIASGREEMLARLDGLILTGGDDIDTRTLGVPLHPKAECMAPGRQEAEFATLRTLDAMPGLPVLGICLGMQMMGVHRGCPLIQHLADVLPDADRHREDRVHLVETKLGSGPVRSWHHQALAAAGGFEILGHSDDGVIEAIRDPSRPFYVGVQWHPERTDDPTLGVGVVARLVEAARR
jgi:putative glutamine amidotransferase